MIDAIEQVARRMREAAERLGRVKPRQQLGHILVATDLSDDSMQAVRFATRLAKRFNSKLTLLYVYEIARSLEFMRGRHTMEVMEKDVELAYERFEQLCRCIRAQYGKFEMCFRVGNAGDEIVWAASALDAEILVIAAEDRGNNGAEVNHVLRDAKCPVLLVHREDCSFID